MKKQFYIILILVLTFILLATNVIAQTSAQEPEFNLVHASINPDTHIESVVHEDFIERVERLSEGRIKYEYFPGSVLGDEPAMIEGLQIGAISTARVGGGALGAMIDGYICSALPFLYSDPDHMFEVLRSPEFAAITEDELREQGLRTLEFWWMGTRHLYTKEKIVRNTNDLQGLKIRMPEIPIWVETWKYFGAIPTPISLGEVYGALQTGIIDGGEGWLASYIARGFYEQAPYITMLNWAQSETIFLISEIIWQQLPPDLQDVMLQAARENAEFAYEVFYTNELEIYDTCKEKGATITEVEDIEEWRKLVQPLYKRIGEELGPEYAEFIDFAISTRR